MRKKLEEYMSKAEKLIIEESTNTNWDCFEKEHLIQISFFQHERMIHLIVTVIFALLTFTVFIILNFIFSIQLMILLVLLLCLLIPYISHYYYLENGVQKLYEQYDMIIKIKNEV